MMRRRKREDGTYSDPESYHSADSFEAGGRMADKKKKEKEKKEKKTKQNRGGEDSDHSYYSETSEGGTRRTLRKKKIRDAQGNVIGYEKPREYDEGWYQMIKTVFFLHFQRKMNCAVVFF